MQMMKLVFSMVLMADDIIIGQMKRVEKRGIEEKNKEMKATEHRLKKD